MTACSKNNHPASPAATTSIYFTINDSTVSYPVNLAYIQDVDSLQTTLISGQFPDTASKQGSLAIRFLSDTTGRFQGSNLLVTYTDGLGNVYYNSGDSSNYVQVDKYPKSYDGVVSGSFSIIMTGEAGTVTLSKGSIIALYQQ
jgi:hypothetical protein